MSREVDLTYDAEIKLRKRIEKNGQYESHVFHEKVLDESREIDAYDNKNIKLDCVVSEIVDNNSKAPVKRLGMSNNQEKLNGVNRPNAAIDKEDRELLEENDIELLGKF